MGRCRGRRSRGAATGTIRPGFGVGIEPGRRSFQEYVEAARLATSCGLGINAGHDLDLENLVLFRTLPDWMKYQSAMPLSRAQFSSGLATVVHEYLAVVAGSRDAQSSPSEVDAFRRTLLSSGFQLSAPSYQLTVYRPIHSPAIPAESWKLETGSL